MKVLRSGDNGASVKRLQKSLQEHAFSRGAIDGDCGSATEAAVIAFQRSGDLLADGIAGPRTPATLGSVASDVQLLVHADYAQFSWILGKDRRDGIQTLAD